jgi:hypothetical protein
MKSLFLAAFFSMTMVACLDDSAEPQPDSETTPQAELQLDPRSLSQKRDEDRNAIPGWYWYCPSPAPQCIFVPMNGSNSLIQCQSLCRAAGSPRGCRATEDVPCL